MGGTPVGDCDGVVFPSERPQGLGTCWVRLATELAALCNVYSHRPRSLQGVPFTRHLLAVVLIISQVYESLSVGRCRQEREVGLISAPVRALFPEARCGTTGSPGSGPASASRTAAAGPPSVPSWGSQSRGGSFHGCRKAFLERSQRELKSLGALPERVLGHGSLSLVRAHVSITVCIQKASAISSLSLCLGSTGIHLHLSSKCWQSGSPADLAGWPASPRFPSSPSLTQTPAGVTGALSTSGLDIGAGDHRSSQLHSLHSTPSPAVW